MSDRAFFDTTVLVYAVSVGDRRADVAEGLLADGGWISVQVLNEFVSVSRRKLQRSWKEINEALASVRALCGPVLPIELKTHERALKIAEQTGYHIYDSLVVAAALEARCNVLYSEDMQDGRRIEGLTIRNPFRKPEC